jgi:hypothetical protein
LLSVAGGEFHLVQKLIPTLEWKGGLLGVRLRFEPDDATALQSEYLAARKRSNETLAAASGSGESAVEVSLWISIQIREAVWRQCWRRFHNVG